MLTKNKKDILKQEKKRNLVSNKIFTRLGLKVENNYN